MTRILGEEKYANGTLEYRKTLLDDQLGKQVTLLEAWYPSGVDPPDPWQATDSARQRDGQQRYKENYMNERQHGLQEGWYPNGQQRYKENYMNERQHGLQEGWYPNGQPKYKGNYVNGQRHGIQEGWYPSGANPKDPWQATDAAQQRGGQQYYKENYVNGQQHGLREKWYKNGQPEYKLNFVNGQQHGPQEIWREDGQQKNKFNYANGQLHGIQEYWVENGQLDYKKYYLDDTQVSQETYQAYIQGLALQIQEALDLEEPNLSKIIAKYLLP
jgi:antitoxin component YwqK of YwqJK toxin-antitoxin module